MYPDGTVMTYLSSEHISHIIMEFKRKLHAISQLAFDLFSESQGEFWIDKGIRVECAENGYTPEWLTEWLPEWQSEWLGS